MSEKVSVVKAYIDPEGRLHKDASPYDFAGILSRASGGEDASTEFHEPPYDPQGLVDLATINITHFRCARTKASDAAGIGYKIVHPFNDEEVASKEDRKVVEEFLATGNPNMPYSDVLEQFVFDRETVGWGVIELVRTRDQKTVARWEPVAPQTVRVVKKTTKIVADYAQIDDAMKSSIYFQKFPREEGKYINRHTGEAMSEYNAQDSANEMIFWPRPYAAISRYYGVPEVIPAVEDILCAKEIRSYFLKFFENSCIPRYAVVIKGGDVTQDVQQKIEKFFKSEFKGEPHKTLILSSDGEEFEVTFEVVDQTQKEADYRETRKDLRDFIRVAHGIPPVILGIVDTESRGSASGLSQAEIYLNRIVKPLQRGLHFHMDSIIKHGLGIDGAVARLEAPDVRNLEIEMRRDTAYVSHGILSINEIRKKYGLDPIPGGDQHKIWSRRTAPQPVGMDDSGDEKTPAQEPEG